MNTAKLVIKQKEEGKITLMPEEKETIDNKLELMKFTSEVQSRLKKDITSDFVLAKLNDKDKTGVIDLTSDAYWLKRIMKLYKNKKIWEWDKKDKTWTLREQTEDEKAHIDLHCNKTFDTFMAKITMTVIMNRNVDKNHLIKVLAGAGKDDEAEIIEDETIKKKEGTIMNKLRNVFKPEKKKEEE